MSGTFIDEPVRMLLQYFFGTMWNYINIALKLARITALLGILWCSIQLAFGTMEVRKFFVGTITKFFAFFLIMALYPAFVQGLQKFAIEVGKRGSGQAAQALTNELAAYKQVLEENIEKKEADFSAAAERLEEAKSAWGDMSIGKKIATFAGLGIAVFIPENREIISSAIDYRRAEKVKKKSDSSATGDQQKLLAIKGLLASEDGNKTDSYFLDIDMKDATTGTSLGWLSPDAIARISVLAGEILKENEWTYDVMVNAYYNNAEDFNSKSEKEKQKFLDDVMLGKKKLTITNMPMGALFRMIIVYIAVGFLYITTIGCLIQYIMAITEYAICSSYSIILVPCMLFDGLKDMASKVLPMLMAQAVKLSILTLCMFFNAWMYLQIATKVTLAGEEFGAKMFFYVVFDGFLTFVLCLNGPKLASVIMTGSPQMSMGEFIQAAGAVAAGAAAAHKATEWGNQKLAKGVRKGVNAYGNLKAAAGAAKGAWDAKKAQGKGNLTALGSALGSVGRETGSSMINSAKQKALNWVHTGKTDGGTLGNQSMPSAGFSGGVSGATSSGSTAGGGSLSAKEGNPSVANQNPNSSNPEANRVSNSVAQGTTSEGSPISQTMPDGSSVVGLDAEGNAVSSRFQNTVAQRFEDAQTNNGAAYTGKMGAGTFGKMRYNNAYARAYAKAMKKSNVSFTPPPKAPERSPKTPDPKPSLPPPGLPKGNPPKALPVGSAPKSLPPIGSSPSPSPSSSQKKFDETMFGKKDDAADVSYTIKDA